MKSNERLIFIDFARSFAILCVILCHVIELAYVLFEYNLPPTGIISEIIIFSLFTLGRLGVPLFLFISGYLLLNRNYKSENILRFWKTKWLRLLLTAELWIILFYIFPCLSGKKDLHFFTMIKQLLFLEPCNYSHMWYMPMILGLYLFLPFVALVLQQIKPRILLFPGIMTFVWLFILPIANIIFTALGHSSSSTSLSLNFSGGTYGFYLILGFLVSQGVFRCIRISCLGLVGVSTFIGTVLLQVFSYHNLQPYNVWYDCGLLLICALCIFESFSRVTTHPFEQEHSHVRKPSFLQKLVGDLSKCSFGIYILHNPILIFLMPYSHMLSKPISIIVLFIIVTCISWFIVHVACTLPIVGKVLFYAK